VKTPDKFRFSLQWGSESVEKVQAGEFLEGLGNRKSEFVVLAVTEYLAVHPDVMSVSQKPQIVVKPSFTQEQVKAIVLAVIEEKMSGMTSVIQDAGGAVGEPAVTETDIDEMLKNLDMFSK